MENVRSEGVAWILEISWGGNWEKGHGDGKEMGVWRIEEGENRRTEMVLGGRTEKERIGRNGDAK